jgi:exosome complex exonuclease RRP6
MKPRGGNKKYLQNKHQRHNNVRNHASHHRNGDFQENKMIHHDAHLNKDDGNTKLNVSRNEDIQREDLIRESNRSSLLIGDQPIDTFIQNLFGQLVKATNVSNHLPQSESFSYYRASSQQFNDLMTKHAHQIQSSISNFMTVSGFEELENDSDDVSHIFEATVDLLDHYYENVDTALDELDNIYNGKKSIASKTGNKSNTGSYTSLNENIKVSVRPQLKWTDIDNSNKPFIPKIREKPNAYIASLEKSMKRDKEDPPYETDIPFPFQMGIGMGVGGPPTRDSAYHPYEPELICLEWMPWQIQKPENPPIMYKGLQNVNCIWINNVKELYHLASILDAQKEFAIDLEQHSYRTFQGFVCLMQISTREQDYLVDALELREHMHILNSSFTNPKIVKVMHGCDCDILWLQRDFGIYVVNLFDTGKAAQVLGLPGLSLAYLLKYYCGVIADKKYQLSDWRVRPLPSEMVKYARQDTHYLLYIYDRLRHDLYDKNTSSSISSIGGTELLDEVLKLSREICLRRYEKELFTETSYLQVVNRLVGRSSSVMKEQELIIRALYKWRDAVARQEDESIRFVLPDHMIITISEHKPTDVAKLMQICAPVPKLVRRDAALIVKFIQQALKGEFDDDLIIGKKSLEKKQEEELLGIDVPKTMIRTPEISSRHLLKLESPVLSTDQLYQVAGWVEQSTNNKDQIHSLGKLRADLSDGNSENDISSDDDDNDMEPNDAFISDRMQTPNRSVVIRSTNNSSLFSPGDLLDISREEKNCMFDRISHIRNSFSLDNLISPMNSFSNLTVSESVKKEEKLPFKTPIGHPSRVNGNTNLFQQEPVEEKHSSRLTPPEERVPSSLNEIYKLSHKNRKRNKQKKKLKQDLTAHQDGTSGTEYVQMNVDDNSNKNNSRSSSFDSNMSDDSVVDLSESKPVEFMKKIGWLGDNDLDEVNNLVEREQQEANTEVNPHLVIKQPNLGHANRSHTRRCKNYKAY